MDAMPMFDGGTMSMAWMPMCGQSWIAAAASFLGMWTLMMAAMMLPSLAPLLWRYRWSGRAGELPPPLLSLPLAGGYLLVWMALGAAVYPLGVATVMAMERCPALGRAVPIATGVVVLLAGALQLTPWKARHLACCRNRSRGKPGECGQALPATLVGAWRQGLRLGVHCSQCCAGLTAALLVTGIMSWPGVLAATLAVNLERLAPAGERVARTVGMVVIAAGLFLTARAFGL